LVQIAEIIRNFAHLYKLKFKRLKYEKICLLDALDVRRNECFVCTIDGTDSLWSEQQFHQYGCVAMVWRNKGFGGQLL